MPQGITGFSILVWQRHPFRQACTQSPYSWGCTAFQRVFNKFMKFMQQAGKYADCWLPICPMQGAAETRNRLLDEACGVDYVIFWDDDITPLPGCIDAYVESFKKHPEDAGFAGVQMPACLNKLLPRTPHHPRPHTLPPTHLLNPSTEVASH